MVVMVIMFYRMMVLLVMFYRMMVVVVVIMFMFMMMMVVVMFNLTVKRLTVCTCSSHKNLTVKQ